MTNGSLSRGGVLLVALASFAGCRTRAAEPVECPAVAPAAACPAAETPAPRVEKAHRARTFALSIVGVDATPDKRQRCLDEIHSLGAHLDGSAPVRAKLLLAPQNALRITSVKRGVVLRESLGSWIVPQLCKEVTLRALAALSRERDDA